MPPVAPPSAGAFLPVVTDRLTIRLLDRDDIDAFTAYRNDPEIARLQEWDLPYLRSTALELVDSQVELDGPRPDRWVQFAVDDGTGLVGDVAVGPGGSGAVATIGYTLDPRVHGRGYATEAVDAVVGRLFERGLHRVEADDELVGFVMVAELVCAQVRSIGAERIRTSWVEGRGGPGPFHRSNGFVPTGEVHDGEVVAERRLV